MQWIHFKAGWGREGKTKSRVRVEVSVHPCLKARLGGLGGDWWGWWWLLWVTRQMLKQEMETHSWDIIPGKPRSDSDMVMTVKNTPNSCLGYVLPGQSLFGEEQHRDCCHKGSLAQFCYSVGLELGHSISGVDVIQQQWRYPTLPFSLTLPSSKFTAQARAELPSRKEVFWSVSAITEITLHLVHHVDVTKHMPLFSWGIANIWVHYI